MQQNTAQTTHRRPYSSVLRKTLAAALTIGLLATTPAHAQFEVTDPAHMGMNMGQWMSNLEEWAKNMEEWKKNYDEWQKEAARWVSGVQSMASNPFDTNSFTATDAGSEAASAELDKLVTQLEKAAPCGKIKETISKQLCDQEQSLKIDRARLLVATLKDAQPHMNQIAKKVKELNAEVKAGQDSASSASGEGSGTDSHTGRITALQAEILAEQNKVQEILTAGTQKIENKNNAIGIVHSVRVDYATTQIEGKEPGIMDKLISTVSVVTALEVGANKAKNKANELNAGNQY